MLFFIFLMIALNFITPFNSLTIEDGASRFTIVEQNFIMNPSAPNENIPDDPSSFIDSSDVRLREDFKAMGIYDFFHRVLSRDEKESTDSLRIRESRRNYLRGQMFLQKNEPQKALRFFEKSSELDKEAIKPQLQAARCHLFLSQYKKTLKICEEILKHSPNYAPAMILAAKSRELMGQLIDAEKYYLKVLEIEPNNLSALKELGTIYYQRLGKVDQAVEIYTRILTLNSKDIMSLVILGSAYAIKDDVDKSLEYYSTAVHYRPSLVSSYINLAKLFAENKNFAGAKKIFHKALMTAPQNEEIIRGYQSFLRLQAIRKYGSKKIEDLGKTGEDASSLKFDDIVKDQELLDIIQNEFMEAYRELAEDSPTTHTELIALYADFLMRGEQYDEAERQYKRILRVDVKNYKAQVALGNIALLKGDHRAAINAFDMAVAINPDNAEVYSQIGAAYLDQQEYHKALDLYEKTALVKPEEEKIQLILFNIYEKLKMDDKAENALDNLVRKNPKRPEFFALQGEFFRKRERHSAALNVYRKAYELRNSSRAYAGMIINLLLELEQIEEAALFTEQAQEFMKQKKEFFVYSGLMFANFGYFDTAIRFLESARNEDPVDLNVYAFIAGAYNRKREFDKAVKIFMELRDKLPDETGIADYYELLGSIYAEQGDVNKADETFGKAANLNPRKESVYLSWTALLNRKKQSRRIRQIMDDAFKHIDRNSEKGVTLEARILTHLKEYDRAEFLYKSLLEKDPENLDHLYNLGLMYYDADKFDEAEEILRKVIDKNPDHADAYNNLGYMFAERGVNLDEAEKLVRKALYLRPSVSYIIDSLAWIYFHKGEYEKSLSLLLRAERLSLDDPVLFDHLGDVYKKLGENDKAREYWKRAYKLDPDIKGLKEKL